MTPVEESIERGSWEVFAPSVGRIGITLTRELESSGVATLIGTNILLTAAHVVEAGKSDLSQGRFFLEGSSTQFTDVENIYLPPERLDLEKVQRLKEKCSELDKHEHRITYVSKLAKMITLINEAEVKASRKEIIETDFLTLATEIEALKKEASNREYFEIEKLISAHNNADIAIVQLKHTPYNYRRALALKEEAINIPENKTQSFFGVSVNCITNNSNGKRIDDIERRHIAIFNLPHQTGKLLRTSFVLPDDYATTCEIHADRLEKHPKRFIYDQQVFLMGSFTAGDSGSPLIGKFGDTYKIVGIASRSNTADCKNSAQELVPGKPFHNEWVPVSPYAEWIKETLEKIKQKR